MLTQFNISKNTKLLSPKLNTNKDYFNRGIEVILNGGKTKQKQPFHILINKVICFFNTEIDIHFEFSLNLRKKK